MTNREVKSNIAAAVFFILFGIAIICMSIINYKTTTDSIVVSAIALLLISPGVITIVQLKNRYEIQDDDNMIQKIYSNGKRQRLQWSEVDHADIKPITNQVVLSNRNKDTKIVIDFQLHEAWELWDKIGDRFPHLRQLKPVHAASLYPFYQEPEE
jgi:hypothetical protein